MPTATFDSLGYAKRLEAAGFTRQQAETQADAMREVIEDRLATKTDVQQAEERLRGELREIEYRLTIRLGAMLAGAVGILAAFITFAK